ncbi:MAG: HAMP domain-containing sensor histidine kinase [Myxococcota bacterium]
MRLTAKIFLAFCLTTLLVLGLHGLLRVYRERELFELDMRRDAVALAATLARAVEEVVSERGIDAALAMVKSADERAEHINLRWVSLSGNARLSKPIVDLDRLDEPKTIEVPGADGNPGSLVTYVPVGRQGVGLGPTAIEFEESLDEERSFVRGSVMRTVSSTLALFGLTAAVIGTFGLLTITRPLRALLLKARRARSGDLSGDVLIQQNDEIRDLADEFNRMCADLARARLELEAEYRGRIAALEQVRRTDRLATVGQLAAGIAHEVGTPLGVIAGRAKMIASEEVTGADAQNSARIVAEQAQRISGIVRQLLDFARKRPPEKSSVDLKGLTNSTCEFLAPLAKKQGVELIPPEPQSAALKVSGDAGQLQQVITNLVVNAIQASGRGKRVEAKLGEEERCSPLEPEGSPARWLALSVQDQGAGMSPETREHVFEPFFTTKDVGEGTGLGLSVAHGIVREHGGWIDVESEIGRGSRFTIYLPVPAPAQGEAR